MSWPNNEMLPSKRHTQHKIVSFTREVHTHMQQRQPGANVAVTCTVPLPKLMGSPSVDVLKCPRRNHHQTILDSHVPPHSAIHRPVGKKDHITNACQTFKLLGNTVSACCTMSAQNSSPNNHLLSCKRLDLRNSVAMALRSAPGSIGHAPIPTQRQFPVGHCASTW